MGFYGVGVRPLLTSPKGRDELSKLFFVLGLVSEAFYIVDDL